jgi:eukaryotic-like serine/threonine-protein kinase
MVSQSQKNGDTFVDLTGQTLGDYQILRRLGRGGMADVYLALQSSLKRQVAIKVLKADLASDNAYVRRFHHEAQAAAALVHPNIVQIFEVGQCDGVHFIAQEYVRGQNLKQFINRHGAADPIMAVNVIRQVASALLKASQMGVVHRDIKPENIMLATSGEVKVADFGLARINNQQQNDLTQIGITLGTPLYMSPEQVEGSAVDTRSDIYSLGITSYHMLAGRPPYQGETALSIAVQHVKQDAAILADLRPDLPPELPAVVHKMMSKRPEDRYESAAALLKDLRKIPIDFEGDWEQLIDKLAFEETIGRGVETVPESRLAATQQLAALMSGQRTRFWQTWKFWIYAALLLVVGISSGVVYALNNPPIDLLNDVQISDVVPKLENAKQQYRYARWQRSEKAWIAVSEYFDEAETQTDSSGEVIDNGFYIRQAQENLGRYYLDEYQLEKAERVYEYLAGLQKVHKRHQIVGMAGLAVAYHLMERDENDVRLLLYAIELDLDKLDSKMRGEIEMLMQYYQPGGPTSSNSAGKP